MTTAIKRPDPTVVTYDGYTNPLWGVLIAIAFVVIVFATATPRTPEPTDIGEPAHVTNSEPEIRSIILDVANTAGGSR